MLEFFRLIGQRPLNKTDKNKTAKRGKSVDQQESPVSKCKGSSRSNTNHDLATTLTGGPKK